MKLHTLQYLRAAAALAVVYSHAVIQVDDYRTWLPHAGSFGVDIFFVISGFIMIYIMREVDSPLRFFSNRVRRVVPLYWFFTFVMAFILIVAPGVFRTTHFEWSSFLQSLFFIPHFSIARPEMVWPMVAPGWSLNYEMYFYLLFALSLMLAARFRVMFITACIAIVFLLAHLVGSSSPVALFYQDAMVFEFTFGMLLARAWQRGWQVPPRAALLMIIIGTTLLLLRLPLPQIIEYGLPRIIEYGLPSLLIVTGCLYIKADQYRWAEVLGDASYSLYLSHIFVLGVLRKLLPPLIEPVAGTGALAAWLFVAASLLICTLVSVPIHFWVDNWLLRHERLEFGRTAQQREA